MCQRRLPRLYMRRRLYVSMHLVVLIEVGDVDEGVVGPALLVEDAVAVELAVQALGEGELLVVGERLVVEDEDGVLVHAGADLRQRLLVMDVAQVDVGW